MEEKEPKSKWLAYILDDLIRIPGTNKRIGLDPILGLIPGAGEFLSSGAGLAVLAAGLRKGIPLGIYIRMVANWALNALVGLIPGVGDLFSFWFKSNQRNFLLMKNFLDQDDVPKGKRSLWPLVVLIVVGLTVFSLIATAIFLAARYFAK